tara:strand:- start:3544 stop:3687 length:144 start_codon:yes stop_codon:yes gene_type:complete
MYNKLGVTEYEQIMTKVNKAYLPDKLQNEKKKPKLTLKQLFYLKGKK